LVVGFSDDVARRKSNAGLALMGPKGGGSECFVLPWFYTGGMLRVLLKWLVVVAAALGLVVVLLLLFPDDVAAPTQEHKPIDQIAGTTEDQTDPASSTEQQVSTEDKADQPEQPKNDPLSGSVRVRVVNDRTGEPVVALLTR